MAQKFKTGIALSGFTSASSQSLSSTLDGESYARITVDAGGKITWGDGTAAGDATLYRSAADTLKTDDVFQAASGLVTLTTAGAPTASIADGALAVDTTNDLLYVRSNGAWVQAGGSSVTVSDAAPSNPSEGDLWYESDTGDIMVYYDSVWVDVGGTSVANIALQSTAPSNPIGGDLWMDTDTGQLFVRYSDGTSDQWIEVGASSAAASGVDGAVQFASGGTFSSDATNLYWDDVNDRLGIGTNTPTVSLDVVGDTFVASASGDDYLNVDFQADDTRLRTRLSRSLSMDGQSVSIVASDPDTDAAVPLSIDGDPVTITNLTGAGAVDFSLADSVDLSGSNNDFGTAVALNSGDNQLVTQLVTDGSTWGEVRAWNTNTEGNIELYLSGSTVYVGNDVDAGSGTMFVDSSTNRVGIGTASPNSPLHIKGSGNILSLESTGTGERSTIKLLTNGSDWEIGARGSTATPGDSFYIYDNDSSNYRIVVDTSGNVGIGTTTPNNKLQVAGNVYMGDFQNVTPDANGTGHLMIGGSGYVGFASLDGTAMWVGHNSGSRDLYLATDETARVTVTGGGNVGINDTTPSYKLDVNGEVRGNEVFVQKVFGTPSSAGWYTIAACPSGRASGLFNVHDPRSSYHESLVFYVSHMYGRTSINILSHNYFSAGGPITQVRHRYGGTYDGGAIQVYFQANSGGCEVFLSENYSEQTWTLKNFVADGTDPGTHSGTWSSMTSYQTINMGTSPARGSTWATGAVNGSSKPFSIPHPTLGDDYTLRHCAIEGPENAVYYRGRCTDGTITMPEYWDGLVDLDTISVQLTPIGDHRNWVESISGRTINVGGDGECFYVAYGERKDIPQIIVEEYNYPDPIEIEEGP